MAASTWDIACRVVDHYGDVGIAWRLARQLTGAGHAVRLLIDGLDVLARIEPRVAAGVERQRLDDIELIAWAALDGPAIVPADQVVELLGCGLSDAYLDAMEARRVAPVWIDFEHLSAESWIDGFHGLPSPHPSRSLVKHFFYPGFTPCSGGLLVEPGTVAVRSPRPAGHAPRRLSLFAYPDAPVSALFAVLGSGAFGRWTAVIPGDAREPWHEECAAVAGSGGSLSIERVPFTDQQGYDRLLASCDVNVVRGEDSFVRAQLAGRPLIWHAYRQAEGTHMVKLSAFEARYDEGLSDAARERQRHCWTSWNEPGADADAHLRDWLGVLPALEAHAAAWEARLIAEVPAVQRLIAFASRVANATTTPLC